MSTARQQGLLALLVAVVGLATAVGSIRSPDAEITFRVGLALAEDGTFAVEQDLRGWPDFGLPRGRDGRRYAVFGPLQSLWEAPFIRVAVALVPDDWRPSGARVPPSFYYADGAYAALAGRPVAPQFAGGHLVRTLVSFSDLLLLVLIALGSFRLALALSGEPWAAWLAGCALPLGTHLLGYSTSLFSEPLALALTLAGLIELVARRPASAGLCLALAATAHISALLALPFALAWAAWPAGDEARDRRALLARALRFVAGCALPLLLLGLYDQLRFGSPFETGRGLQTQFGYGVFVAPWRGLAGLLWSPGKGLLWYCPLLLPALALTPLAWRRSDGTRRVWLVTAVAAALFRLLFIAARSDWHAGIGLGPRYLLLALPLVLVPASLAARAVAPRPALRLALLATLVAAVVAQLYFACGEIYLFTDRWKLVSNPPTADAFYLDWRLFPFGQLLATTRGPILLRWLDVSARAGWIALSLLTTAALLALGLSAFRSSPARRA